MAAVTAFITLDMMKDMTCVYTVRQGMDCHVGDGREECTDCVCCHDLSVLLVKQFLIYKLSCEDTS